MASRLANNTELKCEIWATYTSIILSQKLIKLPVLNDLSQVECIYAVQDPKLSSEIEALGKEGTDIFLTHAAFRRRTDLPQKTTLYLEGRNSPSRSHHSHFL